MTLLEILTYDIPYANINLLDVKYVIQRNELPTFAGIPTEENIFTPILESCLNSTASLRPSATLLLNTINSY
jgi:hypothetical protein